jgi:prepilin-type N-terminal cleavage/methylation domain-containing protein
VRKDNKRFKGFTLIELLFVIALIGVLASFGVSMMQKRTENFKVEKTALQMQHMLQAGMAWNVDHKSEWPQCGNTRNHSQDQGFYVNYIGENVTDDPWGLHSYQWCNTGQFNPPMGNRFFIDAEARDNQTAKRIAALLPSADICVEVNPHTHTSCSPNNDQGRYVRAYVNVPGQAVNGGITIKDIGITQEVVSKESSPHCEQISVPVSCNSNETPDIFVAINSLKGHANFAINAHIKVDAWVNNKICTNNVCHFELCAERGGSRKHETAVKAVYLTMCKPKSFSESN